MAMSAKTKAKQKTARVRKVDNPTKHPDMDAISLLEADHRDVEDLFEAYESLTDAVEKKALADRICLALKVHTQIEEELFYPPARETTGDGDMIDEAIVEHMGAKTLIAQIEAGLPGQPLYDAKIKVLGEQVRHHVAEEEQELFPEVRAANVDLAALGAKLAARKAELMALLAPPPQAA
jgi:hemerythrin superfamily protein